MWIKLLLLVLAQVPYERVFAFVLNKLEKKPTPTVDLAAEKAKTLARINEQRRALELMDSINPQDVIMAREALEAWAAGKPTPAAWSERVRGEAPAGEAVKPILEPFPPVSSIIPPLLPPLPPVTPAKPTPPAPTPPKV